MAFCDERNLLVEAYATVTKLYSDAVATLQTSAGGSFGKTLKATEDAREECIKARSALRHHRDEHGC